MDQAPCNLIRTAPAAGERVLKPPDDVNLLRLIEASGDLVLCYDKDGKIGFLCHGWERVLGWKPSEMVGRHYQEFIHPDDLAASHDVSKENGRGEEVQRFVNRYRTKTGTWRDLEWQVIADERSGRFNASARDISQECARLRGLERLGEVTGLIANPVVVCDCVGQIEWANETFERLTGQSLEQVRAQKLESILHNQCTDRAVCRCDRAPCRS